MNRPDLDPRLAEFPAPLRALLEAELAAGNEIVEVASCFPAPPAGAYAKLARSITTRPRVGTPELSFYDRNSSIYSGEWTDAKRFYFVIEPPRPPEPEPDMDAIRNARNAAQAMPPPSRVLVSRECAEHPSASDAVTKTHANREPPDSPLVKEFRNSMAIDYEKWREGIGYDVTLLTKASASERKAIESLLLDHGISGWREVEALAALRTEGARRALKQAMISGKAEVRAAVIRHAPKLVSDDDKVTFILDALRTAEFYGGLSEALDQVAAFHPPEVVTALFEGALERQSGVAIHFAAMLLFLHGKAKEPFDWDHRPFCLRFGADSRTEREVVFRELCERVGVAPEKFLAGR
jgi:hypothetical protein